MMQIHARSGIKFSADLCCVLSQVGDAVLYFTGSDVQNSSINVMDQSERTYEQQKMCCSTVQFQPT